MSPSSPTNSYITNTKAEEPMMVEAISPTEQVSDKAYIQFDVLNGGFLSFTENNVKKCMFSTSVRLCVFVELISLYLPEGKLDTIFNESGIPDTKEPLPLLELFFLFE